GWRDLAWLLELNQASYNAASLAAVCSISEDNTVNWLGKPIHPRAGNERLEPLVRAFPVSLNSDVPLMIIGGEALGFRSKPLKRDRYGLYNNSEMKGIKVSSFWIAILCVILGSVYVGIGLPYLGVGLYLLGGLLYCCVELFASTIYVERDGWVFLEDTELGEDTAAKLAPQDYNLGKLKHWGERQLVPKWETPRRTSFPAKLVDLSCGTCVKTTVISPPDTIVPLALHGDGITCMLVKWPEGSGTALVPATKVGMCNLPPYILRQTVKAGTIYVGSTDTPLTAQAINPAADSPAESPESEILREPSIISTRTSINSTFSI
ncbi:hypothetical protein B0H16DRAFT_1323905, partial [Mycena metata]